MHGSRGCQLEYIDHDCDEIYKKNSRKNQRRQNRKPNK